MSELCESLKAEHRVIERVLDVIEMKVGVVESGGVVDGKFFADAIAFIREFADGAHHKKEEGILFPRLEEAGVPKDGGPIGVMLSDHDQGRAFVRAMDESREAAAAGDSQAQARLVEAARGYVDLLRAHIQKEDNILFAMADQMMQGEAREAIHAAFAEAEASKRDVTDKRRAWADSVG